ncbi:hypothetical protein MF406_03800 [Georgenia sp. TF02-10]|uniref:hypothetical protein n=1 Tax=Georgenia sp. TF02-10 TaxID=2917725 RepID=UPI001FA7C3AA|nr:hypothetical protein [Georgenia sp. TF02-10]UNX55402.1 hypothetical protein MF406_03800 [Georgenia sp. TF02-10]
MARWATGTVIGVDADPGEARAAEELGTDEAYTPPDTTEHGIKASVVLEAPRASVPHRSRAAPMWLRVSRR